ncbi:ran-binding protein 3 isoform X2 [Planococcus citri]|uniref:ran-binding protein 3 isoform X2 n=1 Tax=Planococcus citri TaxID=170843 RepID=UPI0031F7BFC2
MASLPDNNNSELNDEIPINNEKKEEPEDDQEPKNENTPQDENENTTSIDLFGSNRPVNICSPLNVQSSYKPDEFNKTLDSKANCDEKSDKLPQSENNSSSEDTKSSASGPKFVPLNGPSTTPSVSLAVTSSATSSTVPVVSNSAASSTPSSTSISTEFVFGQNLHERVTIEKDATQQPQESVTQNGTSFSEMLFSSALKQESANAKQEDGSSHVFSNGNAKTLSVSAKEYEEARSVKRKYEEVAIVTGEEDEQNVLQINCKLFAFDNASSSWAERGRGTLRVNDKETSEGRNSRLVMRLLGNLRLVLNTKIWSDMSVEHVSKKSVRLTAIDNDGQVRIYLVMASPKDSEQLYNVLSTRIQKKKLKVSAEESTSTSSAKVA